MDEMDSYEYLVVTYVGLSGEWVDTVNGRAVGYEDSAKYDECLRSDGWILHEYDRDEVLVLLAGVPWGTTRIREELAKENLGAWSVYRRSTS